MRIFNLSKNCNVVCNWKSTRSGFKHTANLCKNGYSIYETKICYLNRTWERFEYESILKKIIRNCNYFTGKEKEKYLKKIEIL